MREIKYSIMVVIILTVVFHALVGALFLYGSEHRPTETTTCDMIKRFNGELFCMAVMTEEDDDIRILRSHER